MDFFQHLLHNLANILSSTIFLNVGTILVGLVALYVYQKQKIDRKKDAANILLLEIKNAENHLKQAREAIVKDETLPEAIFTMKSSSWSKYSYLFVRDFTEQEWEQINTFYEKCRLYDEAVEYNNTFFRKNEEQIRTNLHATLADYTKAYVRETDRIAETTNGRQRTDAYKQAYEKFQWNLKTFADNFMGEVGGPQQSTYFYSPKKAFTDGANIISTINLDISISTIGTKLERIINQNFRSRMARRLLSQERY